MRFNGIILLGTFLCGFATQPQDQHDWWLRYDHDGHWRLQKVSGGKPAPIKDLGKADLPLQGYSGCDPVSHGTLIAKTEAAGKYWEIHLLRKSSGKTVRVVKEISRRREWIGDEPLPEWSPDGKSFYYYSNLSGSRQIWQCHVNDGVRRQVTNEANDVDGLLLSNSGKWLVYEHRSDEGHDLIMTTWSGKPRIVLAGGRTWSTVEFDSKETRVAVGHGGKLKVYTIATGKWSAVSIQDHVKAGHQYFPTQMTWRPDGTALAGVFRHKGGPTYWANEMELRDADQYLFVLEKEKLRILRRFHREWPRELHWERR